MATRITRITRTRRTRTNKNNINNNNKQIWGEIPAENHFTDLTLMSSRVSFRSKTSPALMVLEHSVLCGYGEG